MIGCVVPRPIAWVSTQDRNGVYNLAPFSYFNAISAKPPAISISATYNESRPENRKDTLRNILELREFVVNVVNEPIAEAMNQSATDYPPEVDEFAQAGMTAAPSQTVTPPRVAESPINFECMLFTNVPIGEGPGSATLVIGLITYIHIRDDLISNGRIDIAKLQPVGRLAGNGYTYVRDMFEMVRKPYET
jgi:flavin reductase (DIM6/NTAB) family NADH-FMN oxidoreductase RutF